MQEMAIVSINRLDLIYESASGSKRAQWITRMLRHPDQLFTTTLLMVNLVMQFGSECSRRFYQSMDISSAVAPITQVIFVVVCAELAPMFAARQYSRTVAFFGIPILYVTAIILRPFIAIVAAISDALDRLLGASKSNFTMVSREDLKAIVRRIQPHQASGPESFLEKVGSNVFAMQEISAKDIAKPLHACSIIYSRDSLDDLRELFSKERSDFALVLDVSTKRALGIVLPRFLFDAAARQYTHVYQVVKSTLVIREGNSVMKLLAPLRQSRYSIAIVVDSVGMPVGCLTFDEITYYLFGAHHSHAVHASGSLVERNFDMKTTLGFLRHTWALEFGMPDEWTLEKFLHHAFERDPEVGEKYLHRGIELELIASSNKELRVKVRGFVHHEPA